MVRVLHTSDVMLGAGFVELGASGGRMRSALRDAFAREVEACIQHHVQVMLVSGNLFASSTVSPATIKFVMEQFDRLSKTTRVVILPGDLDPYDKGSLYRVPPFHKLPPHMHVLRDDPATVNFPELELTVTGRPIVEAGGTQRPMQGVARTANTRFCIGMACGSVILPMKMPSKDYPIAPQEIENSGLDYIALGHWTSSYDFSRGSVKSFYSGSPEMPSADAHGAGGCLVVDFGAEGETGPRVSRVMTGAVRWIDVTLDTSHYHAPNELLGQVLEHQSATTILHVAVVGPARLDWNVDVIAACRELADRFLHLKVDDRTVLDPSELDALSIPDSSVAGRFVRAVRAKIAGSEGFEAEQWSEAARLGMRLLKVQTGRGGGEG